MVTLFSLSNLWMARRHLLANAAEVCLALLKSADTAVSQKCMTTSDYP
jgi:hypothetical protein